MVASLSVLAESSIAPAVFEAHAAAIAAIGSASFEHRATAAVSRVAHVDRLYVFDGADSPMALRPLIRYFEPTKPHVEQATYARQFLPADPIQRAVELARAPTVMVCVRISPDDIVVDGYRQLLRRAEIIDRVSFLQSWSGGWRCMTVARRAGSGRFGDKEVAMLGSFAQLLMPMLDRNEFLLAREKCDGRRSVADLEARFLIRFPQLTPRERAICARAAVGMSVDGTALDLSIGRSSVLTYRKRAYARLGVTSAYELAGLVLR